MTSSIIATLVSAFFLAAPAMAQEAALDVKPIAEKKVTELPAGPLFWRLENYPTVKEAEAAASDTSLVAEAGEKVWLFTLGPTGGSSPGATTVAEVGPLPEVDAEEFLLRINESRGVQGAKTPVHTHPGSEAFYVLQGAMSQKTPGGEMSVKAGESLAGRFGADTPMQVTSTGSGDLHMLVMFVVDASKPFSSPTSF